MKEFEPDPVITAWGLGVFALIDLIALLTALLIWRCTARVYGRIPVREAIRTLRLGRGTIQSRYYVAIVSVLILFPFVWHPLFHVPLDFTILLCLGAVIAAMALGCPPTILLLTSSSETGLRLLSLVRDASIPVRVVHLFDVNRAPAELLTAPLEQFRAHGAADDRWKGVVRGFIDFVPIVIMDTRVMTAPVQDEIAMLATSFLWTKTLFVVEEGNDTSGIGYEAPSGWPRLRAMQRTMKSTTTAALQDNLRSMIRLMVLQNVERRRSRMRRN